VFVASAETRFAKLTSTSTAPTPGATLITRRRALPAVAGVLLSANTSALCAPGNPATTIDVSVAGLNGACTLATTAPGVAAASIVTVCGPAACVP